MRSNVLANRVRIANALIISSAIIALIIDKDKGNKIDRIAL